jgi:hypothetical protein
MQRGFPRHRLDGMMKVNVFSSVGEVDALHGKTSIHAGELLYRYEFHNSDDGERMAQLPGREFLFSLLADVLDSVMDEENYKSKYLFDHHVFQQFIALIFITYSSTDAVFYGIHKDDYGVSKDKDMDGHRSTGRLSRVARLPERGCPLSGNRCRVSGRTIRRCLACIAAACVEEASTRPQCLAR